MANDETSGGTAVYVPFKTLSNTLDALAQHMPNRIDKTAFPGQSGAVQNQLILAFRFLGFINDDGRPTPVLQSVATTDEDARKAVLKKLIEEKYADLFALNLTKTTPAEFAEQITRSYKVSGDTRLKATRFFLNAADYLGIAVSPLLQRDKTKSVGNGASKGTARKKRARRADGEPEIEDDDETPAPQMQAGESRSVTLKSGGTLTLSATTKFMSLSSTDRNFVFGLIDKLEEYEKENAAE